MTPIHREAAVGFDRAGAEYERGRPDYPEAAVAQLADELGIRPGRTALDLAAGTGKLTRALVSLGAGLIAVEPVAGMREQLTASLPRVRALEGTAEAIPVGDGSVDAVLVAQAFHWFDTPVAAREIHRVLSPSGGLGVIWNSWDESVPWVAEVQRIVHRHAHDAPRQQTSGWAAELDATGLFTPLERATFPNIVRGGLDMLAARITSVSYVSSLPDDERDRVVDDIRQVVAHDPLTRDRDEFEMPYTTTVAWARRR
jgi:SAM-dependent methyltransferase